MNNGKIIAIVGGPRSGKSFLVNLLAKHYGGVAMLEGEEYDFPERIREDIQKNIRPLERIAWFRNKLVKEYFHALEMKRDGKVVVMDNFWMSYQFYIDALAMDFERSVIRDIAEIDKLTLQYPDVIVFLSLSENGIRNFIRRGGREFDQSDDFFENQALPIHTLHKKFFTQDEMKGRVIVIERDDIDFSKEKDLQHLIEKVDTITSGN